VDKAFLLRFWRAVVEEESNFEAFGGQVVDGLRPVNIAQFDDGLDFQDDFTVYSCKSMLIEYSKNQSPASEYNRQYEQPHETRPRP
jgi:hypothetical protein